MNTHPSVITEDQAEVELRMKIIAEALAEVQTQGSQTFGNSNIDANSLVDPMDGLVCDGCQ